MDKIRIDAKQVLKEEVKKYSKQERGRRQADQAYIQKDSDSEVGHGSYDLRCQYTHICFP